MFSTYLMFKSLACFVSLSSPWWTLRNALDDFPALVLVSLSLLTLQNWCIRRKHSKLDLKKKQKTLSYNLSTSTFVSRRTLVYPDVALHTLWTLPSVFAAILPALQAGSPLILFINSQFFRHQLESGRDWQEYASSPEPLFVSQTKDCHLRWMC